MKKVMLFFVMMLLVLISARSLLCKESRQYGFVHRPQQYAFPHNKKKTNIKRESTLIYRIAKQKHTRLTRELKHVLSRDIDEVSLQAIVRLLDLELSIVEAIMNGQSGTDIDRQLVRRDRLLKISTRTVFFVHRIVMNLATSDLLFDAKRGKAGSSTALTGAARKSYLRSVVRILGQCREQFEDKQYYTFQRVLGVPSRSSEPMRYPHTPQSPKTSFQATQYQYKHKYWQ